MLIDCCGSFRRFCWTPFPLKIWFCLAGVISGVSETQASSLRIACFSVCPPLCMIWKKQIQVDKKSSLRNVFLHALFQFFISIYVFILSFYHPNSWTDIWSSYLLIKWTTTIWAIFVATNAFFTIMFWLFSLEASSLVYVNIKNVYWQVASFQCMSKSSAQIATVHQGNGDTALEKHKGEISTQLITV